MIAAPPARNGFAFYAACLFIAAIMVLPGLAFVLDFQFFMQRVISIPAIGFDYMGVFFHEIGHTLAWWLFGYPAIPTFDAEYGGGFTYAVDRILWLQGLVYALLASCVAWLFKNDYREYAAVVFAFTLFHLALAFNQGHDVFAIYMGHGFEILIGCFCILRGIIGHSEYGGAERWMNMIFGCFMILRNIAMASLLIFSDIGRQIYEMQKGGHGFGDFSRIADIVGMPLAGIATLSLVFMGAMLFLTLVMAIRNGSRP